MVDTQRRIFFIYCHTAPNGKRYIGQTCQRLNARWAHGHGYRDQRLFSNAIKKYGWDNFKHEILCVVHSKKVADLFEQHYIEKYKTFDRECGYNITKGGGGCLGRHLSEETKARMSEMSQGRVLSDETCRKISESLKEGYRTGRIKTVEKSEETLKRMSEERTGEGNPMYGRHHTKEAAARIGDFHRGKHHSEEWKRRISESRLKSDKVKRCPVDQYDLDGNYIASYPSLRAAQEATGVFATNIGSCAKGKCKQSCGYIWRYSDMAA